jgi:hypothetical protein
MTNVGEVRKRSRRSPLLSGALAGLAMASVAGLWPTAAFADQYQIDTDLRMPGLQHVSQVTAAPSTPVAVSGLLTLTRSGRNHAFPGAEIAFTLARVSNAPADLVAPDVVLTVPDDWNDNGQVASAPFRVTFSAPAGQGAIVLKWEPKDKAQADALGLTGGNNFVIQVSASAAAPVDTAPPAISASVAGTPGANGWYVSAASVSFTCADAQSGVLFCPAPVSLANDGAEQSVTGTAVDNAGNSSSASVTVNIDQTRPVVAFTGDTTYTVDQTVRVLCTATDLTAGIATSTCADVVAPAYRLGVGTRTVQASASDVAGNTASASSQYEVIVTYQSLCNLTRMLVANEGIANSLCVKLNAASAAQARGTLTAKAGALGAYGREIAAQTGKAITPETASILSGLAAKL